MADNVWRAAPELSRGLSVFPTDVGALGSLEAMLKSLSAQARSLGTAGSATVNVLKNLHGVLAGLVESIREVVELSQASGNPFRTLSPINLPVAYRSDVATAAFSELDEIIKKLNSDDSRRGADLDQFDDVGAGTSETVREDLPTDLPFDGAGNQQGQTTRGNALVSLGDRGVGSIDPLAGVLGETGWTLNQLVRTLGSIAAVARQARQTVAALGESMVALVSEVNPAPIQTFTTVVDDLTTLIDQSLAPTFRAFAGNVPLVVDSLESLPSQLVRLGEPSPSIRGIGRDSPTGGMVGQSLDPGSRSWDDEFRPLLAEIGDLVSGGLVAPSIATIPTSGGSPGVAAKEESIGNVESVVQAAQRSAFSLGTREEDPLQTAFSATVEIKKKADEIDAKLERFHADVSSLIEAIPDRLSTLARDLPETIWNHLRALPGMLAESLKEVMGNASTNKFTPGNASEIQQVRDWIERKSNDLRDWSMRNSDVSSLNPLS